MESEIKQYNIVDLLVTRASRVRAESLDREERSVLALISADTPAQVYDWERDEVIDEVLLPEGCEPDEDVPLLNNNMRYDCENVLWCVRDIARSAQGVDARLVFDDDEVSSRVSNKVKKWFLRSVSVEYGVTDKEDLRPGNGG